MPLIQSAVLPTDPSPLIKLGLEFTQAMIAESIPRLRAVLTEDYRHVFLPGAVISPLTSRDQYIAHMESVLPVFGEIAADLKEVVVADDANTIVLHIAVSGTFSFGEPYANDNLLIMHAAKQADGSLKFVDGKEFVNTKMGENVMTRLQAQHEKASAE